MLPMWWFWYRTLQAFGQAPEGLSSLRAFFIGHLGKYVPGKAMVVVLRTALVRGARVDTEVDGYSAASLAELLDMTGLSELIAEASGGTIG